MTISSRHTRANAPIIQTKLAPPRVSGSPLARDAVLAALRENRDRRVTLILGPAGSGKSTLAALLRKELADAGGKVCWYNLSLEDAEPAQFAAYLVASLKPLGPEFGEIPLTLFNQLGGHGLHAFLAALANEFEALDEPVYLFLEDFHTVSGSEIPQLVGQLTELAPTALRIVLTSRTRPQLDLVRLRVSDQLNEVGFSELRFSLQETIAFLRAQKLGSLDNAQIHRLHAYSEGWAAGLQLLAYSLRKTRDPAGYINRLDGVLSSQKEASLVEYIEQSLEATMPSDELDFLVRSSACRRFNAELCTLLTGRTDAAALLRRFEAENLFVIPIDFDDEHRWYRFHTTFAKFLNERLMRLPESELRRMNRTASDWFAARGLVAEAVRHSMHAGDTDVCISLVEEAARPMIGRFQMAQLLSWIDQLPRERIRGRLKLLLCAAWAQLVCGKAREFEWSVEAVRALPQSREPHVVFELQLLQAMRLIRADDTGAALAVLQPFLAAPPSASRFRLHLLFLLGAEALVHAGEFERARDLAHRCRDQILDRAPDTPLPILQGVVGLSYLIQGDVLQALEALQPSLQPWAAGAAPPAEPTLYLSGYLAEVYYQLDRLDEAQALLAEHALSISLVGSPDSVLCAHEVEARVHLLRGELDTALNVMRRLESLGSRLHLDRLVARSLAFQVHIRIRARQIPAARETLRRLEQLEQKYAANRACAWAEIPRRSMAARAELLHAQGEHHQVRAILGPLIADYERSGQAARCAELCLLCAAADIALGDEEAARKHTRKALGIASRHGLARLLPDHGAGCSTALQALIETNALADDELQLARASLERWGAHPQAVRAFSAAPEAASVGLSPRELDVLRLLARTHSNKSIGRVLNISAGTIKWHLSNIYGKLDAVSREDAVQKARKLKLID